MSNLKDLFKSVGSNIPSNDVLRLFRTGFHDKDGPSPPAADLGPIPCLLNPSRWARDKAFGFYEELQKTFREKVRNIIPEEAIKSLRYIRLHAQWINPNERGWTNAEPHLDTFHYGYCDGKYTLSASIFPTTTYPEISINEHASSRSFDMRSWISDHKSFEKHGSPGHLMMWEQGSLVHRGFINNKTPSEWREYLRPYKGGRKLLGWNGAVYRILILGELELRKSWLREVQDCTRSMDLS